MASNTPARDNGHTPHSSRQVCAAVLTLIETRGCNGTMTYDDVVCRDNDSDDDKRVTTDC